MKCTNTLKAHICVLTSLLRPSIIITLVFLNVVSFFYIYFFFYIPSAALAKGAVIPVQINGSAQPPGFTPAFLTLHVDETVVFINHASPISSYTLKADDGSFSSPPIPTGGQWTITFHTPGSHTYRDTSSAQTITGELLVVDKNIPLLPTPDPHVEATVTALIKNGQNPPDTIIIATHKHPPPSSNSFFPVIILVMGVSISLTLLSLLGIAYYKRYRQRVAIADEDGSELVDDTDSHEHIHQIRIIIENLKIKLQRYRHSLMSKMRKDENEDEDEDKDEIEDEIEGDDDDD